MKKLITLFLILLTPVIAHADMYGGIWKHHYVKVENKTVRLSFKERRVVPTYGLNQGGRMAYEVYIDAWGDLGWDSIDYSLETEYGHFTRTMIKESSGHHYDLVTRGSIWLQGNRDYKHKLQIIINGREYCFDLNL